MRGCGKGGELIRVGSGSGGVHVGTFTDSVSSFWEGGVFRLT